VTPPEEPLDIRLTVNREEAAALLEGLAREQELRDEFEQNPGGVLARYGIEISPAEAIPSKAVAPASEDLERALRSLEVEPLWPWIWRLLHTEEPGGPEPS
jgi:hypothetical protein